MPSIAFRFCPVARSWKTAVYAMSAISLVATARACAGKPRPQIVHPRDVLTQHNRGMRRLFTRRTSEQVRVGTRLSAYPLLGGIYTIV
jgi:hypothetical protein